MLNISTGDRNRTCEPLVQSQTQRPTVATPEYLFVCGLSFQLVIQKPYRQARCLSHRPGRKESNLHTTASKAAGLPLGDTRVSFVKRVPCRSRTDLTGLEVQDLCRSANGTFEKAPAVGFEPTLISLTGRRLTKLATPEYSVRMVGFEPTISCSRSTRPEKTTPCQAFPHPDN